MTKPSPNLIFLALRMAAAIRELHRWNAAVARAVEQGTGQDALRVHREFAGKFAAALGGLFEVEQEWPCVRRITKG